VSKKNNSKMKLVTYSP